MEPSKKWVIARGEVQRYEQREREVMEQLVKARAVAHQIRAANAEAIAENRTVDSGKLMEANSKVDELEAALTYLREDKLPKAREVLEKEAYDEAIREVREINQLNESEYNVLVRDTFGYIERLRVIDQRQRRKQELQTTYRGLGGESLLGDLSAASAAGSFQSVLFMRLELLTRLKKERRLSQSQADEYDRLFKLFYGEASRAPTPDLAAGTISEPVAIMQENGEHEPA